MLYLASCMTNLYNYPAESPSETPEVLAFQGGKSHAFQVCVMQHFVTSCVKILPNATHPATEKSYIFQIPQLL